MTRADDPLPPPDFSAMSAADVLELFDKYGFRDQLGHPLTQCQDFIDLVKTFTVKP